MFIVSRWFYGYNFLMSTLHDRLFKEFFHRFLPEFVTLFFPEKAIHLNFKTLIFLERELIINLPNTFLRIPDVVAEVETFSGQPEVIIVHVEIEKQNKTTLPQRLFEYYALLRVLRQKPILPLTLVLLPKVGGLAWKSYRESLFEEELIHFRYGQVGIRDLPSHDYLISGDPVAATLATLMKSASHEKAAVKLAALESVMNSELELADQLYLVNLVQTYLPSKKIAVGESDIMTHLAQVELTWSERIALKAKAKGKAIGEAIGEVKGKRQLLMRLLVLRFGPLPPYLIAKLNSIKDSTTFDQLSDHLFTVPTLTDFNALVKFPEQSPQS